MENHNENTNKSTKKPMENQWKPLQTSLLFRRGEKTKAQHKKHEKPMENSTKTPPHKYFFNWCEKINDEQKRQETDRNPMENL